jgi:hypothetical protein
MFIPIMFRHNVFMSVFVLWLRGFIVGMRGGMGVLQTAW